MITGHSARGSRRVTSTQRSQRLSRFQWLISCNQQPIFFHLILTMNGQVHAHVHKQIDRDHDPLRLQVVTQYWYLSYTVTLRYVQLGCLSSEDFSARRQSTR